MLDTRSNCKHFARNQSENLRKMVRIFPHMPFMALPRAIEASYISNIKMSGNILDLGCGDGVVSKVMFGNNNLEIFGGDITFKYVNEAKKVNLYKGLNVFDATTLPFKSDSIGSIYSICVLEHILSIQDVLKEAFRIIKPGGMLQFTTPSDKFMELLYFPSKMNEEEKMQYFENLDRRLAHFRYFSPEQWKYELAKAGFINIQCKYIFSEKAVRLWNILEHNLTKTLNGRKIYRILYNTRGLGWLIRHPLWAKTLSSLLLPYMDTEKGCKNAGEYLHVCGFKP